MKQIGRVEEFQDLSAKAVMVNGKEIILVCRDKQIFAYLNRCPHMYLPLNMAPNKFLDYEGQYLQCSNHMALFEIESGDCISGPCMGKSLRQLPIELRQGNIYLGE
jgi:nitrite reductase/ring-hydroxylating ferredoxin subunit